MRGAAKGGTQLRPGRRVRIDGLQKRQELNGTLGKIVRLEDERWLGVPRPAHASRSRAPALAHVQTQVCAGGSPASASNVAADESY